MPSPPARVSDSAPAFHGRRGGPAGAPDVRLERAMGAERHSEGHRCQAQCCRRGLDGRPDDPPPGLRTSGLIFRRATSRRRRRSARFTRPRSRNGGPSSRRRTSRSNETISPLTSCGTSKPSDNRSIRKILEIGVARQDSRCKNAGAKRASAGEYHFELDKIDKVHGGPDYTTAVGPCVEGDRMIVALMRMPAGTGAEPHSHPNEQ